MDVRGPTEEAARDDGRDGRGAERGRNVGGLAPARLERHVARRRADGQRGNPAYGRARSGSGVVGELGRRRRSGAEGARDDRLRVEGEPQRATEACGRERSLCGERVLRGRQARSAYPEDRVSRVALVTDSTGARHGYVPE